MTKNVIVSIKGLQFVGQENEEVEFIAAGEYQLRGDKHIITYEEVDEQEGTTYGVTKNIITIEEKQVEILKSGQNNVQMVFEENTKNMTYYQTPFGELLVGINTAKIKKIEETEAIVVKLEYGLEINYNHVSDCVITIKVLAKETPDEK